MSAERIRTASSPDVTLRQVRRWCLEQRLDRRWIADAHREALRTCVGRLALAIHVERFAVATRVEAAPGSTATLWLGAGALLRVPLDRPAGEDHCDAADLPTWQGPAGARTLRSAGAFWRALESVALADAAGAMLAGLRADFANSLANLVLNRALRERLTPEGAAIEPVHRGHTIFPFPALRRGVTVEDVAATSNLSNEPAALRLVSARGCRFHSLAFDDLQAFTRAVLGVDAEPGEILLPVHPWQWRRSAPLRQALDRGHLVDTGRHVDAVALASQRTCRILSTGFDVKMPMDVTLTGERRLLYTLNVHNAPFASEAIHAVIRERGGDLLELQRDLASICWDDPLLDNHAAAIVRAPIAERAGERVVPALNLWHDPGAAARHVDLGDAAAIERFFTDYCHVLMTEPLALAAQHGVALEPHMQNTLIALRDGRPVRLVMRDLDNAVLDAGDIERVCRDHAIPLAAPTWTHMPAFDVGRLRLVHALFRGHLDQVRYALCRHHGARRESLDDIVEQAWQRIRAGLADSAGRAALDAMRDGRARRKSMLAMHASKATQLTFGAAEGAAS